MNITPKNTKDLKTRFLVLYMVLLSPGCFDEDSENVNLTSEQENELKNKVLNLETEIKVLKWENTRLSLKLRSVDGGLLVRDKKTNLWHYDVERTPYTGIATENFQSGRPRADMSRRCIATLQVTLLPKLDRSVSRSHCWMEQWRLR